MVMVHTSYVGFIYRSDTCASEINSRQFSRDLIITTMVIHGQPLSFSSTSRVACLAFFAKEDTVWEGLVAP